jgi:predicted transcriptional regulator
LGSSKINPNDIYLLWDKGLTVTEISKELNFNRNTIANYIKKHYNLSPQELFKIGNTRYKGEIGKEKEKVILSLWQNENLTQ